jgi:hypothetical protein
MTMGIAEFGIPLTIIGISSTFGAMALLIVITYILKRAFKVKTEPKAPEAQKKG